MVWTMLLLRFILFYLVVKFHCCGEFHLDVYRHFCPYINFCSNSSFPVVQHQNFQGDRIPCCLSCYCDKQCWSFSDCCPDADKAKDVDITYKASCTKARYCSEKYLSRKKLTSIAGRYIMQSRCPYNYTGPIADKCAEKFDKTPNLEDIAVVSDSRHLNRVYKNKYCAECNGVTNIKRWSARTGICWVVAIFNGFNLRHSDVWQHLLDNCEILFLPLPGIQTRSIDCSLMSRRTCNRTTFHLGLDVYRACLASSAPMYHELAIPQTITYRNLFCYLCVIPDKDPIDDVCDISQFNTGERQSTMLLLLDLRPGDFQSSGSEIAQQDQTGRCKMGEIFDRMNDACRSLHCQWYVPLYGNQCVPIGKVVPGVNLMIYIDLVVNLTLNNTDEMVSISEIQQLEKHIRDRTGLIECPLEIAFASKLLPYDTNYNASFQLDLRRTVTQYCSFSFLIRRVNDRLALPWQHQVTIGNKSLDATFKINLFNNSNKFTDTLFSKEFSKVILFYKKDSAMRLRQSVKIFMFPCAYIKLNISEYNRFLTKILHRNDTINKITITTLLHEGFHAINKDEVAVCRNTYLRLANLASIESGARIIFYTQIVIMLTFIHK